MSVPGGNIDVSRFLALGDSITAGYTDGALCHYGQLNSYVNLLAQQFKKVGGGDFKQPFVNPDSVGIGFSGNSCLVLANVAGPLEPTSLVLSYFEKQGDLGAFADNIFLSHGPFHNMGVPGAKAISMTMPGFGNPSNPPGTFNPFFTRMASNPATASVLSDALAMEPTFFSLFIGNNDSLAYALSGALSDRITPLQGEPGVGFEESLRAVVNTLTEKNMKGVIANLPDLACILIPFRIMG